MTGTKLSTPSRNPRIRKFNPGTHQTDGEIIEQFVVRERELDSVLEVLRGNVDSPSCQHVLVVGPRGRGKTMLLVRVASELRTDKSLAHRLFPVRFMEESQEIFDLADFWLEALFHLAKETEERDPILSRDLYKTHGDLSSRWREESLEVHARAAVLEAADRLDRKLVLMVENMQSLCENVDDDFGWKFRGALQSEPEIMLLASATTRFEGLDDADQPFFELFRSISLAPLDTDECRLLWHVVSGDTVSSREIRPLQILTGGNPRLLVIVAEFARHRSLRKLMEELVTLIDEHTEYFRGHLEILAKTERRVYVSLIDLWQRSSAGEIATRARMDVRVVSTMLGRLVDRGAVIAEGRGRKRLYAPAEPLYCIYYKLRRERDEAAVVENLIHFMVAFYDIREISEISEQLYQEARELPVLRAGMERVFEKISDADEDYIQMKWDLVRDAADKAAIYHMGLSETRLEAEINAAFQEQAWQRVIEIIDEAFASLTAKSWQLSEEFIGRIFRAKAFALEQLRDFHGIVVACDELVRRSGCNRAKEVKQSVASMLLQKGRAKMELGDFEGASITFDEVVERYGSSKANYLKNWAAMALNHKGKARRNLDDTLGAISAWEELIERYSDSKESELQNWVASALIHVAEARKKIGDSVGAAELIDNVICRYSKSTIPDLQYWVAAALIDKGRMETELDDLEGALANFTEVVERYGDSDESNLQRIVAGALFDKGRTSEKQGDLVGAIASWKEIVIRYGNSADIDLQRFVTGVLIDKGRCQAEVGRADEALNVCEQLEYRSRALHENEKSQIAWLALCIRVLALIVKKETVAAMNAFCSVYAGFSPKNEIGVKEMLRLVSNLVAAGASEVELVAVLSTDPTKSAALTPLIVALRERQGETVRAPAEVREVAADVREQIDERVRNWAEATSVSPESGR